MDTNLPTLLTALGDKSWLFRRLREEEIGKLAPYVEVHRCEAGHHLFEEGEAGDSLALVASGALEVKRQTAFRDTQIVVALLSEGSVVGELSLVDGQPRSATVVARVPSELIVLRRASLDALIRDQPEVGIVLLQELNRLLALRLRRATERLAEIF
jgi:CRP-like cAMP-binding protein